jgi:hypothetical protein
MTQIRNEASGMPGATALTRTVSLVVVAHKTCLSSGMGGFLAILLKSLPPIVRIHLFLARFSGMACGDIEARLNWKIVSPPYAAIIGGLVLYPLAAMLATVVVAVVSAARRGQSLPID